MDKETNNNQIDNTDYYRLPCGKYLEDFIVFMKLDFAFGSALKYLWRAGQKDGESYNKDRKKADHYVRLIERKKIHHSVLNDFWTVEGALLDLLNRAREWDGKENKDA